MSSRLREIASSALGRFGIPGIADIHVLAPSAGGAGFSYWEQFCHGNRNHFHTDLEIALGLMTTGRNDTLLVTPDSHPQADAVTWDKNMTHLVGMFPPAMMNQRSRIGHSVTVSPLLTVSGYGNLIANLYFPYGLANSTDLNLLTVSGDRNSFINCHFLPSDATPLDEANFDLVTLNCGEVYFKSCYFGGDSVAWTNGDMLRIYGGSDRSTRAIFEDCIFVMYADNAQVNFIETVAGNGRGTCIFRNCQFINVGTSLTYAIDGAGLNSQQLFFDNRCSFAGVTDIVALAGENYVWFGGINTPINQATGGATVALFNGIACHPDVS